jgi:acetamidase/formamidase
MPGMTLEVKVKRVVTGTWGWTGASGFNHEVNRRLGLDKAGHIILLWDLDAKAGVGRNQHGDEIKLRPFMGVMGMPADVEGLQSTIPPRRTGGNLDCKELVAGTSLFLPIEVEGGLFSTGDGHAVQGDGEVCVTAIECPMDEVELEFLLHEGEIPGPRVRTPDSWTTLGLHEDLNEATFLAIDNMLSLLAEQHGLDKANALAIASVAIDLRITQIVNQVKGVHAVLRDDAISLARR